MNVRIVDGSTRTGLFAPDGSLYVVQSDGSALAGVQHPCGALNVTPVSGDDWTGIFAKDGSVNVVEDTSQEYYNPCGALNIQIVEGIFI